MKENKSGQPDVMKGANGNVILCGSLRGRTGEYSCLFLEERLKGKIDPIRSEKCPLEDRSRTCEVLKPIQTNHFSSETEDTP